MVASSTRHHYSSLQRATSADDNSAEEPWSDIHKTQLHRTALSWSLLLFTAMLGFAVGLIVNLTRTGASMDEISWSYGILARDLPTLKKTRTRFDGSFEFSGQYRGPPSPEIDREWDRFTFNRWADGTASVIAVNEDDIKRAGKLADEDWPNTTVEYGKNMLRKAVHHDYYENMRPLPNGTFPHILRTHLGTQSEYSTYFP
ncbi:hypothetical protein HRG_001182 [Hirsutella rhossiliensis]|uniref:Uncharacterized protein n=1 Tax=Hirsutella rhossiliensis TaxID=111463 RepID=A0A9P8SP41_9HYPO|nr:uncharacterized protein HRG_01182 [Hirsutella rhossiliensis]KAH0968540.1 hypothetical protein HRG_01182 [Hirsutella rhossiliensis]